VLHRFGNPDDATVAAIIAKLDPSFPADNFELNWLLIETLATCKHLAWQLKAWP
jgi:hypothetical protein